MLAFSFHCEYLLFFLNFLVVWGLKSFNNSIKMKAYLIHTTKFYMSLTWRISLYFLLIGAGSFHKVWERQFFVVWMTTETTLGRSYKFLPESSFFSFILSLSVSIIMDWFLHCVTLLASHQLKGEVTPSASSSHYFW